MENQRENPAPPESPETPGDAPEPARSYTYSPARCQDGGLNQMRFELGDTVTENGEKTCMLCDEEYAAILAAHPKGWNRAKLACLDAILMKLSYEVNTTIGKLSYSLGGRAERWKQMHEQLKRECSTAVPVGNPEALSGACYFCPDMLANKRKGGIL